MTNCINVLSDGKKKDTTFIPYRNSKLTRLLKDSLGGQTPVLMIVCLSPNSCFIDETMNSIKYAQKAKKIKECPTASLPVFTSSMGPKAADRMLKQKLRIEELEREVKNLREQLSLAGCQFSREEQRKPTIIQPQSKVTLPAFGNEEDWEELIDSLADDYEELNSLKCNLIEVDKNITLVDGKIMSIQDEIGSSTQFDSTQQLYKDLKELADVLESNLDLKEDIIQKIDQQTEMIEGAKLALKKMYKDQAAVKIESRVSNEKLEVNRYALEQARSRKSEIPELNTHAQMHLDDPMISSHRDPNNLRKEIAKRDAQIVQLTQALKNLGSLQGLNNLADKENIDVNRGMANLNLKKKQDLTYLSGSTTKAKQTTSIKPATMTDSMSTMSSLVSKLLAQYKPEDDSESPLSLKVSQAPTPADLDGSESKRSFRSRSEDIMELELGIVPIERESQPVAVDYQKLDYYSATFYADRVNETNPMSIFSSGQESHNSRAIKDLNSNDMYLREQLLNMDSYNRGDIRSAKYN